MGSKVESHMPKILFIVLSSLSFIVVSCATKEEPKFSPKGPSANDNNMSWNRPMGPEGAGALGILDQR